MAKNVPAVEYLDYLRRSRPSPLLRLLARMMVRCGSRAGWALRVHARDVEYRANRNLVEGSKDLGSALFVIVEEPDHGIATK